MDKKLTTRNQTRIRVQRYRDRHRLGNTSTAGLENDPVDALENYCKREDPIDVNDQCKEPQESSGIENIETSKQDVNEPDDLEEVLHIELLDRKNDGKDIANPNESDEEVVTEPQEIHLLRSWAVENQIQHNSLDELLKILKKRLLPDLPLSSKTFLDTSSAQYVIEKMVSAQGDTPGEFVYFGIRQSLEKSIDPAVHQNGTILLQVNVDGVPLFKSDNTNFVPILVKVHFDPDIYKAYPVAIYCGGSKPKYLQDYLKQFIQEINKLQSEGIMISGKNFNVMIKCFICDTPARSFLKCTKGHGGYNACERCHVVGRRYNNRMIYTSTDSDERRDENFRVMSAPDHHMGVSPLVEIEPPVNMVSSFMLDFMHLVCLGVMKKLIGLWMAGPLTVRFSQRTEQEINQRLEALKLQTPIEFQRKPRSLIHYLKFKATEFCFFLLYCGPVVLKNVVSNTIYRHLLLLHVACRILCSKTLALRYNGIAKIYLTKFVIAAQTIYGLESAVLNIHSLIHLADDVAKMQCNLSLITAFHFESILGRLKTYIRTPNNPSSQLCRRLHEESIININKPRIPSDIQIMKKDKRRNGLVLKLRYKKLYTISSEFPNNLVLLEDKTVFLIKAIREFENILQIEGHLWPKRRSIFEYPFSSKIMNMWQLSDKPSCCELQFPLTAVDTKLIKLSLSLRENGKTTHYVMPCLH